MDLVLCWYLRLAVEVVEVLTQVSHHTKLFWLWDKHIL